MHDYILLKFVFLCTFRLKTWFRSNMGEELLVGLALLNIHRHKTVEVDEVIDLFAGSKKRNLDFVI